MNERARRRTTSRLSWLLAPAVGACLSVACGSDGEGTRAPHLVDGVHGGAGSSDATGAGGAGMGGTESAAGGAPSTPAASGGGGGAASGCVGCGEYLTTSDARAQLCDGAAPLWEKWTACACVACAQTCGSMCELPPNPGCSTCRVEVAYGACAEPYQACANDL
ncbi:MAG: hypothetical protein WKG00_01675 [Polyangiaceae bacterium]